MTPEQQIMFREAVTRHIEDQTEFESKEFPDTEKAVESFLDSPTEIKVSSYKDIFIDADGYATFIDRVSFPELGFAVLVTVTHHEAWDFFFDEIVPVLSVTERKADLERKKMALKSQVSDIADTIERLDKLEKPFEAMVYSYSGGGSMRFKTLKQARKKYEEYCRKSYFRNGRADDWWLLQHHEDGSVTLLEEKHRFDHMIPKPPYGAKRVNEGVSQ